MALEFSIEITDQDLPFFMDAIKRAEQRAAGKSAQQILDEAAKTFAGSQAQQMPEFVRSRLACVENLVAMAADEGWGLSPEDKSRVVSALTYFCDHRSQEAAARGTDAAKLGREEWLEDRRAELQARMRGRRQSYAPSGNWTPRFKFT